MIEVLHLIDTYRIGGPGKTIINSAKFIDQQRFRIHVGAFTQPDPDRNDFARAVRKEAIPFLDLPEHGTFHFDYVPAIRDYARHAGIAIIHAHGYRTDALSWLAARDLNVALVTTHHGWIRNNWRAELKARFALQLCRQFDGVEVVSGRLLDELPRSVIRSGRAEVVHNGIVTGDYSPRGVRDKARAEFGAGPDTFVMGVIGRLSVEKGCLPMVEAAADLARTGLNPLLIFIGEGPLRGAIEERIAALGIASNVKLMGHREPVRDYYEGLDVLVCPSYTEGLSNAILEAMATGTPVVATRVGGNPEILSDGVNGLLVEAGQPFAMARALERISKDSGFRNELIRSGKSRVEQGFSFSARMKKEEAFYAKVLASRPIT